jgi:hypothetical protein
MLGNGGCELIVTQIFCMDACFLHGRIAFAGFAFNGRLVDGDFQGKRQRKPPINGEKIGGVYLGSISAVLQRGGNLSGRYF